MGVSPLFYIGLALSGVALVMAVGVLKEAEEMSSHMTLQQEGDHEEEIGNKRVLRQVRFPGQDSGGGSSSSSSSSQSGSSSGSSNCNCQPMVVCAAELDQIRQSCQFPDGNSGVCCPPASISSSSSNQGANSGLVVGDRSQPSVNRPSVSQQQFNSANQKSQEMISNRNHIENEMIKNGIVIKSGTPAAGHSRFFSITSRSKKINEGAQAILEASKALTTSNRLSPTEGSQGLRQISARQTPLAQNCPDNPSCRNSNSKYRTIDGSCNNQQNPSWGMSAMPFQRIMPPRYEGGVSNPRSRAVDGSELTNVRNIANNVLVDQDVPDLKLTVGVMQWAQFVDHDIAHTPFDSFQCCPNGQLPTNEQREDCFPLKIPSGDAFYGPRSMQCINFVRSMIAVSPDCAMGYREQQNAITGYLDGSNIYGSDEHEANRIRLRLDGLLSTSGNNMLPIAPPGGGCEAETRGTHCVLAGDSRVNEQPGLTAIHTVWMREHNRVARELKRLNPNWSDEALYQEARRIVVAEYQHISYNEWLPTILGSEFMRSFGINTLENGHSSDYRPDINPTITNEFATAAFRFGHSLVPGVFKLISERGAISTIKLRDHYFSPHLILNLGKLDDLIRWLVQEPGQQFDSFVARDLTNHLFQTPQVNFGMDLMSLNIHRGRDHGLATYSDMRDVCKLPRARSFNDISDQQIPLPIVQRLREVYRSVDDIDLFVGGLVERPQRGSILGPTFLCIIGDQFARLKKGDRYFYDLSGQAGQFNEGQLQEIRRASFARILCDNTETMRRIQPLAFRLPNNQFNQPLDCSNSAQIPRMELNLWRNEQTQA